MHNWLDDGRRSYTGGLVGLSRWLLVSGITPTSRSDAGPGAGAIGAPRAEVVRDTGEVRYLVLADRAVPYLLARVRWPDVAQAISAASPDWIEDSGLFDLPYDPSAVTVSFPQAASVAAGWGAQLHPEVAENVPPYIRRMPANWSDMSPSELRTWGIDPLGRRRAPARPLERLRALQAKIAGLRASAQADSHEGELARSAANGHGLLVDVTSGLGNVEAERRGAARVRLVGRAHIRSERTTVTAGLVDLSERGVQCVLPKAPRLVKLGATLGGPFVLEAEVEASRICLDVTGRISWHQSNGAGTHFGVTFGELANGETEGVQRLLAVAAGNRALR
jgi:hypothetical protein